MSPYQLQGEQLRNQGMAGQASAMPQTTVITINQQLEHVGGRIDYLHDRLALLASRLVPVLRPAGDEKGPTACIPPVCPLLDTLVAFEVQLVNAARRVEDILEQLAL
jgi:hypothetical protein